MSTDQEDEEMNYAHLDLRREVCHVCQMRLTKNLVKETEVCTNPQCHIRGIKFNIPYKFRRYETE